MFYLGQLKEKFPEIPVIMMTAYSEVQLAVESLKRGAFDFISKPWDNNKLYGSINAALQFSNKSNEVKSLKKLYNNSTPELFFGNSPAIQFFKNQLEKVSATDVNIHLTGENGTGKSSFARYIHNHSVRSNEVFMGVDLPTLGAHLFESELFGHKKGAFTDAREDRIGKIHASNKGTLFLNKLRSTSGASS